MEEPMPRNGRRRLTLTLGVAALLPALSPPASAHEKQAVGALHLTIGWGEEPAFTGSRNSVEVDVADATGAAVIDPQGSLSVEVSFGDERIVLPLLPSGHRPGKFRAWLAPTRAGTYSFHVTGTVKGQAIDVQSTCSEQTFHCVTDLSDVQFPVKDPSAGQIAESVARSAPRTERALVAATHARDVAIAAIVIAALAAALAIRRGVRKGA
jgi:hypothetical protein